jgi:hypothetical protein
MDGGALGYWLQIALVWQAILSGGIQRVKFDNDHVFELTELLPDLHLTKCGSGPYYSELS